MGGAAGGPLQPKSTFETHELGIDEEYSVSDVLEAVIEAGDAAGYDLNEVETEYGFLASSENGVSEAVGTENEELEVEYDSEKSELYIQSASRSMAARSLAATVENNLEQ